MNVQAYWHRFCSLITDIPAQILSSGGRKGDVIVIMPKIENKVVVRYRDGKMLKGFTYDFNPHKEIFHVTKKTQYAKEVAEVSNSQLKAVFFVKTFEGNKDHRGPDDFSLDSLETISGLKIKVTFSDGEVMYGSTNGYAPDRKGFFIFPADEESNNERVFIIRESTTAVETWR
jgi:hypothetical protein